MNLHDSLSAGNPVDAIPDLTPDEARDMRRAVLTAHASMPPPARVFAGAGWLAAMAGVACGGLWLVSAEQPKPAPATAPMVRRIVTPVADWPTRRQFQFLTPGGTRLIWITDSEFDLR